MKLQDIHKIYHNQANDVTVFHNLSYEFPTIGMSVIFGNSGTGKTTLFNIMTGKDHAYEGLVESTERMEYLNQKIELFENLTVTDNLRIAGTNLSPVKDLIDKFQMEHLLHKKVKLLSNGEKRRVQIIRSLLVHPNILLCDEPTASLDYNNAVIVCELLKEVSKHIQVIVTSHDEDLFLIYADTILRIKKGMLIEDAKKDIPIPTIEKQVSDISIKKLKAHIQMSLLNLKAHKVVSILTLFLLFCILLSSYSIYYYTNTSGEAYQKDQWMYSGNLIELTSKNQKYFPDYHRVFSMTWDYFYGDALKEAITNAPNVVAYSYLRDYYYYWSDDSEQQIKEFYLIKNRDEANSQPAKTYTTPFFTIEEVNPTWNAISDADALVIPFEIYKEEAFPLLAGTYPNNIDEVIIDENYAKILSTYLNIQNLDEIIGNVITLNISTMYTTEDKRLLPVKIVGITSIENNYEYRVYFKSESIINSAAEIYGFQADELAYNNVKVLIDPSADTQETIDYLNKHLPIDYSQFTNFTLNENILEQRGETIQINTGIVITIAALLEMFSFFLILYFNFFFKKQYKKETGIFENYGYHISKITVISNLILSVTIIIISSLSTPLLIQFMNQITDTFLERSLLSYDFTVLCISSILSTCIYILLMQCMGYYIRRKK